MRRERGQATVELVALVPLLVAVAAAAFAVLAAGRASVAASAAAEAGAAAMLQGGDGADAARRSLAGWARGSTTVIIRAGDVRVTVRPPFPLLDELLTASAEAHAGQVAPRDELFPLRGGDGASAGVEAGS